MKSLSKIYIKAYYLLAKRILGFKSQYTVKHKSSGINVFLYFDYERDFGGHKSNISDENILNILKLLNESKVKTTWFTVGKIFESNPLTTRAILDNGHEIASHTYAHIAPLLSSSKVLGTDFQQYSEWSSKENISIKGFHSPQGLWSLRLLKYLNKHKYFYDLAGTTEKHGGKPLLISLSGQKKLVRFRTACDDWQIYIEKKSKSEAHNYFRQKYKEINPGDTVGFGFHPWILYSNPDIMDVFIEFLCFIKNQDNCMIETAGFYSRKFLEE